MKKILHLIIALVFATTLVLPAARPAFAIDAISSVLLILDNGGPITTTQDLRFSLWTDGRFETGDITGGGAINGAAPKYAGYNTVITRTPDSNGRLKVAFAELAGLPYITDQNQFMMIEYKEDADPDTAYVIYDDTYLGQDMDRFPLIINGPEIFQGIYTNDATTANSFTLDRDNTGGDVTLTFGDTLNETMTWDSVGLEFDLSDDLNITGDVTAIGVTGTGDVDFSGSDSFRIREVPDQSTADCTTVNELVVDTGDGKIYICTVTGSPGTWASTSPSASDFESVYAADAGSDLDTSNAPFTISTGTDDFIVNSNDWNVTAAGALDAASVTANGALTATGTANLNGTANFNGVTNVGDGGDAITVNSSSWDISAAGIASSFTGFTSTGSINTSGASAQRIRESSDPTNLAACTIANELIMNTTANRIEICTVPGIAGAAIWIVADAGTLDTLDSLQFLRSDVSDNYTSGTLTFDAGTTLLTNGALTANGTLTTNGITNIGDGGDAITVNSSSWDVSSAGVGSGFTGFSSSGTVTSSGNLSVTGTGTIGDGGDAISVNTSSWDISAAGIASSFTGFTSTGSIDTSAASAQRIRESSDPTNLAACTIANELIMNTTDNRIEICTVPGIAGAAIWIVADAGTLDSLDSLQFLRSDVSDNYTSGTLTFDAGTTLLTDGTLTANGTVNTNGVTNIGDGGDAITVNSSSWDVSGAGVGSGFTGFSSSGTVTSSGNLSVTGTGTIGDGGDAISVNTSSWDISTAGVASSFTGFTSTGSIDTSAASAQRVRESSDPTNLAACATVNEIIVNTTDNRIEICTATGIAGAATWIVPDAGTLDTLDSLQFLRSDTSDNYTSGTLTFDAGTTLLTNGALTANGTLTTNGITNIGDGGDAITVNSSSWDVSSAGVGSGFTGFSTSGTLTSSGNLSVTGTGTIGDGGDAISVNTNTWDVSTAGVGSGFTGFTSTGTVDLSAAGSLRIREVANEATATCTTLNEIVLDTTEDQFYVCTATGVPGTWISPSTPVTLDLASVQARRTTTQVLTGSFVDVTFDATDLENDTDVVEHDNTNTDRILIKEDGIYQITYDFSVSLPTTVTGTAATGRVRVNDTTVLNGSVSDISLSTTTNAIVQELTQTIILSLTNGDFLSVQLSSTGDAPTANAGGVFTATKMEGIKGDPGAGAGDADTLDTLDSTQFLRSDTTDNYTSGTMTFDVGTTLMTEGALTANGTTTVGDGGDDVSIDSDDWDVSSAGVGSGFTGFSTSGTLTSSGNLSVTGTGTIGDGGDAISVNTNTWDVSTAGVGSGFTGFTSTGVISFSGATAFSPPSAATDPVTCAEGQQFYNSTSNTLKMCTATDTWTIVGPEDFEGVYAADTGDNLDTANGIFTITTGTNDFVVDSNDWNVTAPGALDAASITSNGALTATGTTNLNGTANFNGVTNIGDGGDDVAINSNDWDVSSAGVGSGFTGFSSSGTVTSSGDLSVTGTGTIGDGGDAISVNTNTWDVSTAGVGSGFTGFTSSGTVTASNGGTFNANGTVNLGDGGDTITVNSSDWDINATGDMTGIGAITADGLFTGTAGATISGAAINFNVNSNFATNIGTGTTTSTVSIGGGSNGVSINSSTWDVTTAGAASGFTTVDASGNITTSAGDFIIGTTGLTETTSATDSGAFKIGVFDEFDNSNNTTVQDILDDFDALIGSNAANTEVLIFYPEYPDTVIFEDGSSNNGTLESLYDNTNDEHYYHWTSGSGSTQDISLKFRFALPADFVTVGDFSFRFRTGTTTEADNDVEITVFNATNETSGDPTSCGADTTNGSSNAWTTGTITAATLTSGCTGGTALSAGDIVEVQVQLFDNSGGGDFADIGFLQFDYTN